MRLKLVEVRPVICRPKCSMHCRLSTGKKNFGISPENNRHPDCFKSDFERLVSSRLSLITVSSRDSEQHDEDEQQTTLVIWCIYCGVKAVQLLLEFVCLGNK